MEKMHKPLFSLFLGLKKAKIDSGGINVFVTVYFFFIRHTYATFRLGFCKDCSWVQPVWASATTIMNAWIGICRLGQF